MADIIRIRKRDSLKTRTKWMIGVGSLMAAAVATTAILWGTQALFPTPTETEGVSVKVEKGDVTAAVTGKGPLAAASTANVSFASAGIVTSVKVGLGQQVGVGDELATIDPSAADREIEKARGALSAAEQSVTAASSNVARARESLTTAESALNKAKQQPETSPPAAEGEPDPSADRASRIATAEQAVRDAESSVASAGVEEANAIQARDEAGREVAAAEAARANTVLRAPIAGVVTAINGTIGSTTSGGGSEGTGQSGGESSSSGNNGFIQISDTSSWRVTVAVSETDIGKIQGDQRAQLKLAGSSTEPTPGKVVGIAPTPTTTDGVVSYAVAVQLDTPPTGARLGLTGFVNIITAEAKDVLVLPTEVLNNSSGDTATVKVRLKDGGTKSVTVTTGITGNGLTEIKSGLKAGDSIVATPPTNTGNSTSPTDGDDMPPLDEEMGQ